MKRPLARDRVHCEGEEHRREKQDERTVHQTVARAETRDRFQRGGAVNSADGRMVRYRHKGEQRAGGKKEPGEPARGGGRQMKVEIRALHVDVTTRVPLRLQLWNG